MSQHVLKNMSSPCSPTPQVEFLTQNDWSLNQGILVLLHWRTVQAGETLSPLLGKGETDSFVFRRCLFRAAQTHTEKRWGKRSKCTQNDSKPLDELLVCVDQGGANTCVLWYVHPKLMERLLLL